MAVRLVPSVGMLVGSLQRSAGRNNRATATGDVDEAFLLEQDQGAVCGADRDGVRDGELGDGGQLVAWLQAAGPNVVAEGFGDRLVRSADRRNGHGLRHDAGDGGGGPAVGLVDPGGVDLERGGAAAAVAEPTGNGAEVDAGGETGNQQCSNRSNATG